MTPNRRRHDYDFEAQGIALLLALSLAGSLLIFGSVVKGILER